MLYLIWGLISGIYPHSIVLENLSHKFLKPNVLDIKLGTVLYDVDASEEKRARMLKTAKATTSFETGVRLTGFSVSVHGQIYIADNISLMYL